LETLGGVFTPLIDKNTTIPTKKSQIFSTAEDNQNAVTIRVFQGERKMAADNKLLGQFDLVGISPAPRGTPQIEVTFDIDSNGIVNVSAKDKETSKEHQIQIKSSGGLSEAEIKKMVEEAEKFADEDQKKRDKVEAQNIGENILYKTEKDLKEYGEKLESGDKEAITKDCETLKDVLDKTESTAEEINNQVGVLSKSAMKLTEIVLKEKSQSAPPPTTDTDNAQSESPDVEIVEPDEKDSN
jgi:molecular chaperone DnaK